MRRLPQRIGPAHDAGFSLIEVLVAILVMAIGLLGFALLLTMGLRFSQAANQRTHATNLAYDLLDQMRANRVMRNYYVSAGFAPNSVNGCNAASATRPTGAVGVQANIRRWQCQVVRTLGPQASANVGINGNVVTVTINWNEARWTQAGGGPNFQVVTQL